MPSISKYNGKYRAFVSSKGKRISKVFNTKTEAILWVSTIERAIRASNSFCSELPFADLAKRYADDVSVYKRGGKEEIRRLNELSKDDVLGDLPINKITRATIQSWVDNKKITVSPQTGRRLKTSSIARTLTLIKSVFNKAVEWQLLNQSPAEGVYCRVIEDHRERIASEEDIEKLKIAAQWDESEIPVTQSQRIIAAFIFACRTGMRIGEIEEMEKCWIHGRVVKIPREATKTFHGREVAVSNRAHAILKLVLKAGFKPKIFGLKIKQHDALFRKIRNAAGLDTKYDSRGYEIYQGLNFHDSRATFCTWAASPGPDGAPRLDTLALARQLGHRNLNMLLRYYRKSTEELLYRLDM